LKNLLNFRKVKGWSQKKLSDESGVSQTYISELEANKKQPTVIIAQKLATALNVTLSDLLSENFESPKSKAS
jgi:transcriptional regulator with XRE-family HTH domain